MTSDTDTIWQRAPVCFSCGKDMGSDPDNVIYVGYGRRHNGRDPGWVASLCSCDPGSVDPGAPSPCVAAAQAFAAEDGAPLSPDEYHRWLTSA